MSLDVYIQPEPVYPLIGNKYEYICSIEDDGYYWFLHDLFEELADKTGQYIDLYGGASFHGATLDLLALMIIDARELVDSQPDRWEFRVEMLQHGSLQQSSSTVEKTAMILMLNKLEKAINEASRRKWWLTFWGD